MIRMKFIILVYKNCRLVGREETEICNFETPQNLADALIVFASFYHEHHELRLEQVRVRDVAAANIKLPSAIRNLGPEYTLVIQEAIPV